MRVPRLYSQISCAVCKTQLRAMVASSPSSPFSSSSSSSTSLVTRGKTKCIQHLEFRRWKDRHIGISS
ncbi:hypothetical protein ACLOJK_031527 [Asimina triloba]